MCCKKDADSVLNKGGQQWRMSRWRKLKKVARAQHWQYGTGIMYIVYQVGTSMPANYLPICKGRVFFSRVCRIIEISCPCFSNAARKKNTGMRQNCQKNTTIYECTMYSINKFILYLTKSV